MGSMIETLMELFHLGETNNDRKLRFTIRGKQVAHRTLGDRQSAKRVRSHRCVRGRMRHYASSAIEPEMADSHCERHKRQVSTTLS